MNQVLLLIPSLLEVQGANDRDTITNLFESLEEVSNKNILRKIIGNEDFLTEIQRIVYKTVCSLGLFLSFVEIAIQRQIFCAVF